LFPNRRGSGYRSDFGGQQLEAPFSEVSDTESERLTRILMTAAPLPSFSKLKKTEGNVNSV